MHTFHVQFERDQVSQQPRQEPAIRQDVSSHSLHYTAEQRMAAKELREAYARKQKEDASEVA
jgi:hypothetical protein